MGNKVTVIGFKGSGKTTYLTGMYICMSLGVKNFSLLAKDPANDLYLENLWDKIVDEGEKPYPSDKTESYSFHISHNYKPVVDFDWLDYPGGILSQPDSADFATLNDDIKESDCLLLILDGNLFLTNGCHDIEEYTTAVENRFKTDRGIRNEVKMFSRLSEDGHKLPPIGIVVTKSDLIPAMYQNAVVSIIRTTFKQLFDEPDRIVLPMSVSLGGDIEPGFVPNPRNIEQPIAFAVLSILLKYIVALHQQNVNNERYVREHSGFFSSFFNSGKIDKARNNSRELMQAIDKWSEDAFKLIDVFSEKKSIYAGGIEKNLREFFKEKFRAISN